MPKKSNESCRFLAGGGALVYRIPDTRDETGKAPAMRPQFMDDRGEWQDSCLSPQELRAQGYLSFDSLMDATDGKIQ